ncbi:hypothetical protein C2W62_51625, partial [Candidatus Entotheonella serta]
LMFLTISILFICFSVTSPSYIFFFFFYFIHSDNPNTFLFILFFFFFKGDDGIRFLFWSLGLGVFY